MGFDLTNERIQDTYEQLLQISGSTIVDGTGSVAPVSITSASYADFALTASYAENAGDIDTASLTPLSTFNAYTSSNDSTFNSYTSSNDAEIVSINNQIAALEAGSGSADWDLLTNKPNGLVSSSAQSVANVSGQSLNGETIAPTIVSASTLQGYGFGSMRGFPILNDISVITGSIGRIGTQGGYIQWRSTDTNGLLLQAPNDIGYLAVEDDGVSINNLSFTASNALVSGDLVVNGTASFAYLESITGSAKIIGDAYIVLNNNTPTERYAGVKVFDSGSTNNSASFEFDGQTNDWFYEYTDDGGATEEFGAVMFGPGYNTRGSHVYPSNNKILKGTGDHHIVDSNITDDGTSVTVSTSLTASAFSGDGSGLTGISSTLGNGSGGNQSIITQNVTSQDATSAAQGGIAIGDSAQIIGAGSTDAIAIGRDTAVTNGQDSVAIGYAARGNANTTIAIGRNAEGGAQDAISLGNGPSAGGQDSIVIGRDSAADFNGAIVVGANAFAQADQAIAVGKDASADGDESIAIGKGASASGTNAITFGDGPSAGGTDSIVIGRDGAADFTEAIAIGSSTTAQANNAIGIGAGLSLTSTNEINIGGKFKYDGTSTITLEGDLIKLADSASQTGSLIDNMHPAIASGSSQIKHIVTIDQNAYNSISGSGNVNDDTFYIISDAGDDVYPGNLQVEGQIYSPTFAGTIASSTSSISFDNGNFATLNCASSTFLANPTNLQGGTTYTLIVTNGANISGYGTVWKFAGGTEPTLSANTDVITAVSDGTSLYAAALADFS